MGHPRQEYNPAMPLDAIARRYAETLMARAIEESVEKMQANLEKVRQEHAAQSPQNPLMSGPYITDHAKVYLEQVRFLSEARMNSLIKAYEKSGLSFDESTFNEIKTEVIQFCHQKQHHAVSAIGQIITQAFQGADPPGLRHAAASQIVRGVDGIMARLSSDLSLKRDELLLDEIRNRKAYAAGLGKKWDVFISHATEDKDGFVRPLAKALEASGLLVWYDEFTMTIGDSLRRKIEEGLANSRYGIVVLSPNFFAKKWPQDELDGLASKEIAGTKVILPVWHNIDFAEVQRQAPMLSGRLAAKSVDGLDKVVTQLCSAMGFVEFFRELSSGSGPPARVQTTRIKELNFTLTVPDMVRGRGERGTISLFRELWSVIASPFDIEAMMVRVEYALSANDASVDWDHHNHFLGLIHTQQQPDGDTTISENVDLELSRDWQWVEVSVAGRYHGYSLEVKIPAGCELRLRNSIATVFAHVR